MKTITYPETYESSGNCIQCPYCQREIDDMNDYDFNDDSVIIECDCGKRFYVSEYRSVSYTGKANCVLNKEKHQYEEYRDGWCKCLVCGDLELSEKCQCKEEVAK